MATTLSNINPLRASLHTRIVLLIMAISMASIIFIALMSIENGQQLLKKESAQRLNLIASDRMGALKNIWDLRLKQTEALAANPNIATFLNSPDTEDPARRTVSEFEGLANSEETYMAVRITDISGKVLLATSQQSVDPLSEETIRRALFSPFYKVHFDDRIHTALLETVAPVYDSTNRLAGFVAVAQELVVANDILANKLFLGETGETYLADSSGLMITDSRFVKDAKYTQLIETPPIQECFANGSDVVGGLYTNYRGSYVFGASNCDRNLGIVLISEVDRDEMFASLRTLQYQFLLTSGGIIAVAAALAFFFSRSILNPLYRLKQIMGKVQAGFFEKVHMKRHDEIGELATSFDAMVEEIGIKTKKIHLKNDILSFMASRLEVQADELKKADREKEEYAQVVSHELKSFLVPIIGYSELLLDGTLGELSQRQREKVTVMLERAWSLLYMTQNVLDARMLETKSLRMAISEKPVSAASLLQECRERSIPLARTRNLDISIAKTDDEILFPCDSKRILQVLDNLVNNAIKATAPADHEKTIRLRAERRHEDIIFSVKDMGKGIPWEIQPTIFRKFYETDKTLTREAAAKGLGLAISKGIIEAHGGRIWFESAPDVGSSFYFSIPQLATDNYNASSMELNKK